MRTVVTLAAKDLRILLRDKFGLFWIFVFPLMYALFFGSIFGGESQNRAAMPITVIDRDQSPESRRLIETLDENAAVNIKSATRGGKQVDAETARSLVRHGDRVAYLLIRKGFGDNALAGMFGPGPETPAQAHLEVGIDPARSAEAGYLQGILMEAVFGGFADAFSDKTRMGEQIRKSREQLAAATDVTNAQKLVLGAFLAALDKFVSNADTATLGAGPGRDRASPIDFVDIGRELGQEPRTAFEITFPSAVVWGLMGCAAAFAITIVRERTAGTLLRLRVAPLSLVQLLAGKGLACFTACAAVIVILLGIGRLMLGVRLPNPGLLALAVVCTALCFTGIMMAMSVLGKTEPAVAGAGWGIMMPFAMIGGGMVPLIAMPKWMLTASNFSPFKWGIYSIEGAVWRGFSFGEMLLPCVILLGIGLAFFGTGVWIFKKTAL